MSFGIMSYSRLMAMLLLVMLAFMWAPGQSMQSRADAQIVQQDLRAQDAADDVPTALARGIVDKIDRAGGKVVDKGMAITLTGVLMIAVYRILQFVMARSKTPVGTVGWNILAKILALLFGSESVWQNAVVSKRASVYERQKIKQKMQRLVEKKYPALQNVAGGI